MVRKVSVAVLAIVVGVSVLGRTAQAQGRLNQVPVLVFEPSTNPHGILTVDTSRTVGMLKVYAGLYFSYVNDPLRAVRNGDTIYKVVHHQVVGDLVLTLGLWEFIELGVHLPAVFYHDDDGDAALVGLQDLDRKVVSLGDVRIAPKVRFWRNTRHGFGLAVIPQFTVHSGFEDENAGEQHMTFEPKIVLDYKFQQGTVIALNAGYRARKMLEVGNLRVDDEFFYGFGMEINLYRHQLSLLAEIYGAVAFKDAHNDQDDEIDIEEIPVEAGGALRYRAPFGLILTVGGSAGLTDGWAMPDFRVFVGLGFTTSKYAAPKVIVRPPRPVDSDADGLEDKQDNCPQDPEDQDGFKDEDGCPEPDNDGDGVCDDNKTIQANLDKYKEKCTGRDQCADKVEDKDGFEDEDGCPEPDNDKDGVCDDNEQIQKDLAKYAAVCKGKDRCMTKAEDKDGFEDEDGCPEPDNDKDGVCDDNPEIQKNLAAYADVCKGADKCPDAAEDKDGHLDDDGCPEPDNDGDGFCDSHPAVQNNLAKYAAVCKGKDKCPDKPETINGYKDNDGCPDRGRPKVKVTAKKIVIMEKVYFKTNKARIKRKSFALLAMVATTLKTHVRIKLVRVEGHTDERGKDERNMRLSERRAKAVRDFLVKAGVEPSRLVSKGYGETTPVVPECSKLRKRRKRKKCWAKNRRVEFVILKQTR
jgi:outer membrane protein OmpA-like peptidoglycan-associated protein